MKTLFKFVMPLMIVCLVNFGRSEVIYNIQFSPSSPASLALNQNVNISFNYESNEAGGIRIFPRPFTNGSLTPSYAASGSPLYPVGNGTGNAFFTITSGSVIVDHIRFQVLNADQSQLLLEFYIPVHFIFSTHAISNIVMTPTSPAPLQLNQNLSLSFDYTTDEAGGVRIFARPFTNGSLTPSYAASGSPLYPVGSGSGNGTITITTGDVTVDSIRFQMLNADQSQLLLEFFVPVDYHFAQHAISNIQFTPSSPSSFQLNENLNITFDYTTNDAGGVRIFARPFTNGSLTPSYAASGSPLYPVGNGSGSGTITITTGDVTVDSIRFQMLNADQSQLLLEFFVPVDFHFGSHSISNIQFLPTSPAYFTLNHNDTISFDYTTNQAGGVRIFPRPFTGGSLTPGYAASGSPLYSTGSGSGNGWYRITAGDVIVDHIRFQMLDAAQTQLLLELFIPVRFYYGSVTTSSVQDLGTGVPETFALGQNYPNPFNPTTTIRFDLPKQTNVSLKIYNLLGQEVSTLVDGIQQAGHKTVEFDARSLPSGIYIYRLVAGNFVAAKKLVVLK
ncbi:MAG: T9SS type A sorting domain-containing protein [Ignavibacteriae bacterium]|nr:T9SS type A sorting domain-containing protein [Ignavibacteriota bacterium]